jgi:hypothetical protein
MWLENIYAWNQRQKLDTNENWRYFKLEAIYFNPCDGSQDYPSCVVQMLI